VESAQLTPDTLQLIRTQAPVRPDADIAAELGWSVERLHHVVWYRRLGVHLITPAAVQAKRSPKEGNSAARYDRSYDFSGLSIDDIIQQVPRKQAVTLAVLRRFIDGEYLQSDVFTAAIGVDVRNCNRAAKRLGETLALGRASWRVDTGRNGYRLVTWQPSPDDPAPEPMPDEPSRRSIDTNMSLDEVIERLTPLQAAIMRVIEPTLRTGRYLSGSVIAEKLERSNQSVTDAVFNIRRHLGGSRWRIDSSNRKTGGYRLVERS
jgi:biotin operon repressor